MTRIEPETTAATEGDRFNVVRERFRIFEGIESDIFAEGSIDYPDDVLGLRGLWRMPTSPRHRRSAKPASDSRRALPDEHGRR
jgi:hypothetical protein